MSLADADHAGLFTTAQADRGRSVYYRTCASCHGDALQGKIGPALSGRQFRQMIAAQSLNGASLFQFISEHMPLNKPGSLSKSQYVDLFAYLLQQNGFPSGEKPLSDSSSELQKINLAAAAPDGR